MCCSKKSSVTNVTQSIPNFIPKIQKNLTSQFREWKLNDARTHARTDNAEISQTVGL